MRARIEGLWIGGALSVEAATVVAEATGRCAGRRDLSDKARAELTDLENAIYAQIQKAQPDDPSEGLI